MIFLIFVILKTWPGFINKESFLAIVMDRFWFKFFFCFFQKLESLLTIIKVRQKTLWPLSFILTLASCSETVCHTPLP